MGVGCLIRAHWSGGGFVLFFLSAFGCWYISRISCWSSLPPQHIKFPSVRVSSNFHPPHFKWQRAATTRHCESSQCLHWRSPPSPILSQKDMLWAASWVVCKACLANTVPLKRLLAMLSKRRRGGFLFCVCAGLNTYSTSLSCCLSHIPSCLNIYIPSLCSGSLQCHITFGETSHVVLSFEERLLRAENASSPSHWHFESSQDKTRGLAIRENCLGSLVVFRERR